MTVEKTTQRRNRTETLGSRGEKLAIVWAYPDLDGRVTFLPSGRTVLGRDFTCDVRLAGDETSRQHAEIMRESAMVVIGDLNSMNGIYVDGRRVSRAPIDEGSVIRIGDWVGVVLKLAGEHDGAVFQEIIPGYFGGPKTLAAVEPLRKAAASDLAVIIEGETGTGKEGIARATHLWSGRKGPFIAVNCAALPEALAEGELFGYRKGAFTSADRASPGLFQAANGGTLFLDEVTDLASDDPIEALARARAERGHAARRNEADPDRRSRRRGDAEAPRGLGRGGAISRRLAGETGRPARQVVAAQISSRRGAKFVYASSQGKVGRAGRAKRRRRGRGETLLLPLAPQHS